VFVATRLLWQRDVRQVLPERHGLVILLLAGRLGLLGVVELVGVGDEGDDGVLSKGEVDDGEDVDEHEGEDDEADEHVGVDGEGVVDEPADEAGAQEVHVDANDHQPQQPREHDNLQNYKEHTYVVDIIFAYTYIFVRSSS